MTTFRDVERARRKCLREHELNKGRWAVVHLTTGSLIVRTADKAERITRKHPENKIIATVPANTEVTS